MEGRFTSRLRKTKRGSFMSEADAQKAGYREAKASPISKEKPAADKK